MTSTPLIDFRNSMQHNPFPIPLPHRSTIAIQCNTTPFQLRTADSRSSRYQASPYLETTKTQSKTLGNSTQFPPGFVPSQEPRQSGHCSPSLTPAPSPTPIPALPSPHGKPNRAAPGPCRPHPRKKPTRTRFSKKEKRVPAATAPIPPAATREPFPQTEKTIPRRRRPMQGKIPKQEPFSRPVRPEPVEGPPPL